MDVLFFVPDQADAWERIDRHLMAKRAGYSLEVLDGMWKQGMLTVHEMATKIGTFGYLVLAEFDLGVGRELHVMWCEVRPCKALVPVPEWLTDAAAYLQRVAAFGNCVTVRIAVANDHPSPSWRRRLEAVGFKPLVTQLGISVAA